MRLFELLMLVLLGLLLISGTVFVAWLVWEVGWEILIPSALYLIM